MTAAVVRPGLVVAGQVQAVLAAQVLDPGVGRREFGRLIDVVSEGPGPAMPVLRWACWEWAAAAASALPPCPSCGPGCRKVVRPDRVPVEVPAELREPVELAWTLVVAAANGDAPGGQGLLALLDPPAQAQVIDMVLRTAGDLIRGRVA